MGPELGGREGMRVTDDPGMLPDPTEPDPERGQGSGDEFRNELPRPSVLSGTVTAASAPERPPRSPWRMVVYLVVFLGLVGLSLLLRASTRSDPDGGGSTSPINGALHSASPSAPSAASDSGSPTPLSTAAGQILETTFATQACNRPDVLQTGFRLVAAFETDAATAASWEDALAQGAFSSSLHSVTSTMRVAVCYIDGPWKPPDNVAQYYQDHGLVPDRGIVFVPENGAVVLGPEAPHDSLPILRPHA